MQQTATQQENIQHSPIEPDWRARLRVHDPRLLVHLIGIGGTGLSAIAHVLLEMGMRVSGSDRQSNRNTDRLSEAGARIYLHQRAENLSQLASSELPDIVLISSAVPESNPELQAAIYLGLPVVKRSEFLPVLLANRHLIAVAGTHGKTTTTGMIVQILNDAGLEPGFIVGAEIPGIGNASAGRSDYFVIEADEYDHMFLGFRPKVTVITNIEWDHPDCYPTPASFQRAFMQFVEQTDPEGLVITCKDDPGAEQLRWLNTVEKPRWITYGLDQDADIRAGIIEATPGSGIRADFQWWNAPAGDLRLRVPGLHNVRNALAALAVSCWCGVQSAAALSALSSYRGAARRFERKGEAQGVLVIDDYAHHPTEVRATLTAARQQYPERRIWAVFQPHTFSRTKEMLSEMAESFAGADRVIVTDIYASREVDTGNISAKDIVAASSHPSIQHIGALTDVAKRLHNQVQAGDVVITLGAGDGNLVGEMLLQALGESA